MRLKGDTGAVHTTKSKTFIKYDTLTDIVISSSEFQRMMSEIAQNSGVPK